MHEVFVESGLTGNYGASRRTPIATICSGSTLKAVVIAFSLPDFYSGAPTSSAASLRDFCPGAYN